LKTKDGNSSGAGNTNQQELPQLNKVAEEKDETVNITEVACPIHVHNCIGLLLFVRVLYFQLNQSDNLL
jgi:hypothetical protein